MPSSSRPAKQLLFMWLKKELSLSGDHEFGLDVACGYMQFRPLFKTAKYIGVEIDRDRLNYGVSCYPEVSAVHSSIEDLDPGIKGDFVICIQTIGANRLFIDDNALMCVRKLVDATRSGGTLLLTIGPSAAKYIAVIDSILRSCFDSVSRKEYGAFNRRFAPFVSKAIALLMYYIPALRRTKEPRYYFSCKNRLSKHSAE